MLLPDDLPLETVLACLHDGVYVVDPQRRIVYWNDGAARISGYAAADVLGTRCADNLLAHVDAAGRQLCIEGCPLQATLEDGRVREAEVFLHHKDGHRVPVLVRVAPVRDEADAVVGAVEAFSDRSQQQALIERLSDLQQQALLDPLTGLANRRLTQQHVHDRVQEMGRYGWPFGVAFLDIDRFKAVNDAHGHDAGDRVLRLVARVLAANLRSFDLAGRWGGEEFVVTCPNVDAERLAEIAGRLRLLVERSAIDVGGQTVRVTVSLGATLARDGDSVKTVIDRADQLMYASKEAGRNRVTTDA